MVIKVTIKKYIVLRFSTVFNQHPVQENFRSPEMLD